MTARQKKTIVSIFIAFFVISGLIGGGIYFYLQKHAPDYFITFDDSKEISYGTQVILSGIEIGRVVSVKPSGTGIAVGINVADDYQENLTEASRFFIDAEGKSPRLLVKNISSSANPLAPGQIVEGTDSLWQWNVYNYAQDMNRFFESNDFRQTRQTVRDQVEEMDRRLNQIKWDQLGNDLRQQMDKFSRDLETTLNDKNLRDLRKDLDKKVQDFLASIDQVQNSQEARELREAVENFRRRVLQELAPPGTADTKPEK